LRIGFRLDSCLAAEDDGRKSVACDVGTVLVDERTNQLRRIEGKIPADVNLGYGLLGTVHAGSSFSTEHEMEQGGKWKEALANTAIEG
jgi:hypothetical protein